MTAMWTVVTVLATVLLADIAAFVLLRTWLFHCHTWKSNAAFIALLAVGAACAVNLPTAIDYATDQYECYTYVTTYESSGTQSTIETEVCY
jgi:hypothetical protein